MTPVRGTLVRPILAWVMLLAGFAAIAGSFLPWAYIDFPAEGRSQVSGSLVSDLITAFFGVVLAGYAVPVLRGERLPIPETVVATGSGLILVLLAAWDSRHLLSMTAALVADDTGAGTGPGLWLCGIGGLAGAIAALALAGTHRRTDQNRISAASGR
ncbi:hypothetical protein [Actinoplanes sp. L3-i22]|uniref:hypothetical protein n=1 Tax=Actinoplanes sp. L3-i22 TaxID=2836373 RepID=UPI001C77B74B|nr:hypothetical protein [Actinoplanes sp. L3-i22]BCY06965.1 hypothetical protein L3i22_020530 [Actinoplanes sp. L3-i22]